jgi:hypothetical protein
MSGLLSSVVDLARSELTLLWREINHPAAKTTPSAAGNEQTPQNRGLSYLEKRT